MAPKEAHVSARKFLALVLRHKPEEIGISLDEHGWADVNELVQGMSKRTDFSLGVLEEIVATDSKQRYSFNEDRTLIRANQGHSIEVDVELEQKTPPLCSTTEPAKSTRRRSKSRGLCPKAGSMFISLRISKRPPRLAHRPWLPSQTVVMSRISPSQTRQSSPFSFPPYSPSLSMTCLMESAHSSCWPINPGHAFSLPLILQPSL